MTHLLLFYRIIFYTFGFSLLGFTLYKYLKTRNRAVGAFLFLWTSMTLTAAAYVINYYIFINFDASNFLISYLLQGVTIVLIGFSLIYFVHTVFNIQNRIVLRVSVVLASIISIFILLPFKGITQEFGTKFVMFYITGANIYSFIVAFKSVLKMKKDRKLGLFFMYSFAILFGLLYLIDINPSIFSKGGHFLFFPFFYIWIGCFCIYIGLTRLNLSGKSQSLDDFILKYSLTKRESEIALLLADGLTYKGISEKLYISPGTVSTHVKHIYEKTGTSSKIELNKEISRFKP